MRFWEESFFDALSIAISRQRDLDASTAPSSHSLGGGSSAARRRAAREQETTSELATKREAAFAALGTFACNMSDMGIQEPELRAFVNRMSEINALGEEQRTILFTLPCFDEAPAAATGSSAAAPISSAQSEQKPSPRAMAASDAISTRPVSRSPPASASSADPSSSLQVASQQVTFPHFFDDRGAASATATPSVASLTVTAPAPQPAPAAATATTSAAAPTAPGQHPAARRQSSGNSFAGSVGPTTPAGSHGNGEDKDWEVL
jgi:hypothetical protein